MSKRLLLLLLIFSSVFSLKGQIKVNISSQIHGFRHGWDCGSDDGTGGQPDPRFQVWIGYNANWSQSTNPPGLFSSCGITYGADNVNCSTWFPTSVATGPYITLPSFSTIITNTLDVKMRSWEEDRNITCCSPNHCDPYPSSSFTGTGLCHDPIFNFALPCLNPDDKYCGETVIANLEYWQKPPCASTDADKTWTGDYDHGTQLSMHGRCDAGDYGINELLVVWSFAEKPLITIEPKTALGGATSTTICAGVPVTLPVSVNNFHGWTLGRWVKWQIADDVSGSPSSTWTDIVGTLNGVAYTTTTDYTYRFTPVTGTKWYRAIISSDCSPVFDLSPPSGPVLTVASIPIKIIVKAANDPSCSNNSCAITYVDPVNGSDGIGTGTGSPTAPFKTISRALLVPGVSYIRVASGVGTDPNICNLVNNVIIEGGYSRSGDKWDKSSVNTTTITFSGNETNPDNDNTRIAHIAAFKSDGKTGWTVKDLNIVTANVSSVPAISYAPDGGSGYSNYGFLLIRSTANYLISRCNITVGKAGDGKAGTAGTAGTGLAGGDGGGGSAGAPDDRDVTVQAGGTGLTGGYNNTSGGGAGGAGRHERTGNPGLRGVDDGRDGATGNPGITPAQAGVGTNNYDLSGVYFIPGDKGQAGSPGGGGQGGGGGSGGIGAGGCIISCLFCDGGAGVAGGKGGTGGGGGSGGYSGGGAFGIWKYNSASGPVLTETNVLAVGAGGNGGAGGSGGSGTGGSDGLKRNCATGVVCGNDYVKACGGNGGDGGAGATGGTGGPGRAGTSATVISTGSPPTLVAPVYPDNIKIDYSSAINRGSLTGKACPNSEIDLIKTLAGNWTLPPGLSMGMDPSTQNIYSNTANSIKVTTTGSGFFDLQAGSIFKNGLYVFPTGRTLPNIDYPLSEVCQGGEVTLSIQNSWDAGNILERKWEVYDNISHTALSGSPYSGTSIVVSGFPTVTGVTYDSYTVKYRERHNCCGWSAPVFATIRVYRTPTAPVVTPSAPQTICPSTGTISATINPGNVSLNCNQSAFFFYNGDLTFQYIYTSGNTIPLTSVPGVTVPSPLFSVSLTVTKSCGGSPPPPAPNVITKCDLDVSSTYTWTVMPPFSLGTLVSADQTGQLSLCGSPTPTPGSIGFSPGPTGSGSFTYLWSYVDVIGTTPPSCPTVGQTAAQWLAANAGATGGTAPAASNNLQTYIPGAEVSPGHSRTYACLVTPTAGASVACGSAGWASGCRKITVLPAVTYGTVNTTNNQTGSTALCAASTPFNTITFDVQPTGSGSYTYQWYYLDNTTTTPPLCPTAGQTYAQWLAANPGATGGTAPAASNNQQTYTLGASEISAGHSRAYACWVTPIASASIPNCGSAGFATNCRQITVLPTYTNGVIPTGDENLCNNTPQPSQIPLSTPTGSTSYGYTWSYVDIPGTTSPACPASGQTAAQWLTAILGTNGSAVGGTAPAASNSSQTYIPGSGEITAGHSRSYAVWVTPGGTPTCGGTGNWGGTVPGGATVLCRKITMNTAITFGTLATAPANEQTAQCYTAAGYDPTVIGFSVAPTPIGTSNFTYQWYIANSAMAVPTAGTSAIPVGWTAIGSATASTYNPPCCITGPTTYAVQIAPIAPPCGGMVWAGGTRFINFLPQYDRGTIGGGETICAHGTPSTTIAFSTAPAGSTTYAYQWYSNATGTGDNTPTYGGTDVTGWTIIGTGIGTTYKPTGPVNSTTSYAVMVKDNRNPPCEGTNTLKWAHGRFLVTTTTPTKPTGIPSPPEGTYCQGQIVTLAGTTAGSGGIGSSCITQYKYKLVSGALTGTIVGTTSASQGLGWSTTVPILRITTANTPTVVQIWVRMNCDPTGGLGTASTGGCISDSTVYQWSSSGTAATTWATNTFNGINMLVSPAASTICNGNSVAYSATTNVGAGNISWQRSTGPAGTGTSITATNANSGSNTPLSSITYYYRPIYTGTCNLQGTEATLNVVDAPASGTLTKSPDVPEVCTGNTLSASLATPGSGGTGGSCADVLQYRTSTDNGASWGAGWQTGAFVTTTFGMTNVEMQTLRNGCAAGCNPSTPNTVSWLIKTDPSYSATKSPNLTSVCPGQSLTLSSPVLSGGAGTCTISYTFNGGTPSSTLGSYTAIEGTNTLAVTRTCDASLSCSPTTTNFTWTGVALPEAPTATKSPDLSTVCTGETLNLINVTDNGGGLPGCGIEYSVDGGTYSSSLNPITNATVGTHTIAIRKNCTSQANTNCGISSVTTYTWTVVADPSLSATRVPTDNTVCSGEVLAVTDIVNSGSSAGNCNIEYKTIGPGGTIDDWSTTFTPITTDVAGTYKIQIRLNCSVTSCAQTLTEYSWTVMPDPPTPTATRVPPIDTVCIDQVLGLSNISTPATGAGTCTIEYSWDNGVTWGPYTTHPADLGANTVSMRQNCTGSSCDISGASVYTWIGVNPPTAPTATKTPNFTNVCAGATLSLTGVTDNGGGLNGCVIEYSADGGAYSSTLTPITGATVGTHTIAIRKNCSGVTNTNCLISPVTTYSWTVVADPVLSAPANDTICIGGRSTLRTNILSGGTGSYNFIWQYSNDQIVWTTVVDSLGLTYGALSGSSSSVLIINGTGTETAKNYYYRCFLVSTDNTLGCDAFSSNVRLTIVNKPSISNPIPVSQTICRGNAADSLTVIANLGSTRPYSFAWYVRSSDSVVNGTPVLGTTIPSYNPPTTDTGTFYYYTTISQTTSGCLNTTTATAQVIVSDGAQVKTGKNPKTGGVCEGASVSDTITFIGGSGCTDTIQYQFDTTGPWINYTSASLITTTNHFLVRVRAKRDCPGCPAGGFKIDTFSVNNKPDPTSAQAKIDPLCGNVVVPYATLTAADPTPYPGTWTILGGAPGTIANPNSDSTTITGLQPGLATTIRWTVDNNGCKDWKDTIISASSTTMDTTIVALVNNCRNCMIKNGNTYSFFNNAGHIVAKILDYSTPTIELAQTEVCLDIMPYNNAVPYSVPTTYTSYGDNQPYLPRRWSISPATMNSTSHVTLYFTQAEFHALQMAAVGTHYQFSTLSELRVTKFSGGSNGAYTPPPVFPATNGSAVLITPTPVFQKYPSKINGPDYSVEFDISNYSTFYVHPQLFPFAPLPVELISFTGWNEGDVNRLQWVTASEKNTVKFEVQKSLAAATWTTIGEKSASGNSVQQRTYGLDDNNPVVGNNYYRLKIIDADGKFTYSNVINLPLEQAVTNNFVRVFPNPTGGLLNVEIQATGVYDTKIYVYDVVGKKVYDKASSLTKGMNLLQFDFSMLSKGPYILQFQDNDGKLHTTKFVKDE